MCSFPKYRLLDVIPRGPQEATGRGRVLGWVRCFYISPYCRLSKGASSQIWVRSLSAFVFPVLRAVLLRKDVFPSLSTGVP